jgi:small-conductance mechanosensitive channel
MRWLFAVIVLLVTATASFPQTPPSQQKVDDLVRLLQDPEVRTWLETQKAATPGRAEETEVDVTKWEAKARVRIDDIVGAIPRIPAEVSSAVARVRQDVVNGGYASLLFVLSGLVSIGVIAEFLFTRYRRQRATATATAGRLLPLVAFGGVMAVVFFAVEWPPLARIVLFVSLVAIIGYRFASAIIGLAAERPAVGRRLRLFCAGAIVAVSAAVLGRPLLIDPSVSSAISYCFSLVLLLLALESVWSVSEKSSRTKIGLTIFIVALWALWCVGLTGLFWLGVYTLVLPGLLRAIESAALEAIPSEANSVRRVLVVRGSRAIVVLAAVGWIAATWHFNPNSIARIDPTLAVISYGLLKSVVVLLMADFAWHLIRAWIARMLAASPEGAALLPAEAARRGRIRTLLPIFRNVVAVAVGVAAVLIILAQLGVEIGPLIAGAGIFGVAIGFGSQTLVKDVISGVFYMLDDAFRVGEYIQAKTYKGTVEGFSLRSVRLRHHRGPVFTIPFGELGAVENMSRDWVIDKFRISVAYDTDLNVARKIAKSIGAELKADPELGPLFLEPLKMKGVEEFGDYGIVLSFAMTTVPGQQTYIRRKAYAIIREAFIKSGIEFATPSVHVGNDDRNGAAAASATIVDIRNKMQQAPE